MSDRARPPGVDALVVTCEHGGCNVPAAYRSLFRGKRALLESHRGWDAGALKLARRCARSFKTRLHYSTTTRLLVELNRSLHHQSLFSEISKPLPEEARSAIVERYYKPYRSEVESAIQRLTRNGRRVFHLSVHTFTPELGGVVRRADVGFLYDPGRKRERMLADCWREELLGAQDKSQPNSGGLRLRVRRNYPYLGTADGFTTYLRKRFPATLYFGMELEINQRFVVGSPSAWRDLQDLMVTSLARVLDRARR